MSGGSWDYFTFKTEEVASKLCNEKTALRRAFGEHMHLIASAMYEIEWIDSGDKGDGEDIEAIKKVFENITQNKELDILLKDGKALIKELRKHGV